MSMHDQAVLKEEVDGLPWTPLEAEIVAMIRAEIEDKSAVLIRSARREDLAIDSIDIVHVVFAMEEKYGAHMQFQVQWKFETFGDLVEKLASFVPAEAGGTDNAP